MRGFAALIALVLAGSATSVPAANRVCDATRTQVFMGALATADVGRALLLRSGAATTRWLQPATIATTDYRPDRLTVHLDARNFIVSLACG